jgi:uncharacterized protein (TIGR03435 family)
MQPGLLVSIAFAALASAQQQNPNGNFEVATITPSAALSFGGANSPPAIQESSDGVLYNGQSLRSLIATAYQVRKFQIEGPAWLDTERFDISGKLPAGARREQAPRMLRSLLEERFDLKVHRAIRHLPVYELTVAKGGPKIGTNMTPSEFDVKQSKAPISLVTKNKDGRMMFPVGTRGVYYEARTTWVRMFANVQTLPDLANLLGDRLSSLVVDKTGIPGTYDFVLESAAEKGKIQPAGMRPLPALIMTEAPVPLRDAGPLIEAVEDQLGLKLMKKKGTVDIFIVDRADKRPKEN